MRQLIATDIKAHRLAIKDLLIIRPLRILTLYFAVLVVLTIVDLLSIGRFAIRIMRSTQNKQKTFFSVDEKIKVIKLGDGGRSACALPSNSDLAKFNFKLQV